MAVTTKSIIEILPLGKEFKAHLLSNWDGMTDDQKFNIEELLWEVYAELYDIKYAENAKLAFLHVQDNEDNFDKDFYKRIREKTNSDMEKLVSQQSTSVDLSKTREELEKLLNKTPN